VTSETGLNKPNEEFSRRKGMCDAREVRVEIVVTGRNVEVPEHFRIHVSEKLARLERYDHKIVGMEVELFHERNRRQSKSCQRVEITGRGCGPVARSEACGPDFYAALDSAIGKLESRLRRAHDRRRVASGRRSRVGLARAIASGHPSLGPDALELAALEEELSAERNPWRVDVERDMERIDAERDAEFDAGSSAVLIPRQRAATEMESLPGQVVRQKEHTAKPMSIDDALSQMELVGHDFYLFSCVDTGLPSVVYRRKGYDYGLIRLAESASHASV
jgi:ribosomal subunit interface protein